MRSNYVIEDINSRQFVTYFNLKYMNEEGLNELSRNLTKKINEELILIYQHSNTLASVILCYSNSRNQVKKEEICCIIKKYACVRKEGERNNLGYRFYIMNVLTWHLDHL